jgi:hypothetical protein
MLLSHDAVSGPLTGRPCGAGTASRLWGHRSYGGLAGAVPADTESAGGRHRDRGARGSAVHVSG